MYEKKRFSSLSNVIRFGCPQSTITTPVRPLLV